MLNSSKTIGYKPKRASRFALPDNGIINVAAALDRLTDLGGMKTIYVDGNNSDPGDGSMLNPFRDLDGAYLKALGNGTIDNPEYAYGIIVVEGFHGTYSYTKNLALNNVVWYFKKGSKIDQASSGTTEYIFDTSVFASEQATNIVVLGECEFRLGGASLQRGIVRAVGTAHNDEGNYYRKVFFQYKTILPGSSSTAPIFVVKNDAAGYNAHRNALELYVAEDLRNLMGDVISVTDRGSMKMVGGTIIGNNHNFSSSERVPKCIRATRAQSLVFDNVKFYGQYQESMIELGTADFATSKFRNIVFNKCSISSRQNATTSLQVDTAIRINNIDINADGASAPNTTLPVRFLIDGLNLSGVYNNINVIDYTGTTVPFKKLELVNSTIKGDVHPNIDLGNRMNNINGNINIAGVKGYQGDEWAKYDGGLKKGDVFYDTTFNALRVVDAPIPLPTGIGYPNKNSANMATMGLLYNWSKAQAAVSHEWIGGVGWRLPTVMDIMAAGADFIVNVNTYPGYYTISNDRAYYFGSSAFLWMADASALEYSEGETMPYPVAANPFTAENKCYSVRLLKDDDGTANVETLQYINDKEYRVKKLADGKIWMLDNLAYEAKELAAPHKQDTDQYLDFGGPNQVSAANLKGLTQGAVTIGSGMVSEFETARANKQLVPGLKYKVSGFLLEAVESDKISPEALYLARHPDYMNRTGNFIGVWRNDLPGIAVGKLVAWNSSQFRNKTGVNGTSNPSLDQTNWEYAHTADVLQYTVLKTNVYVTSSKVNVGRIEDPFGNVFSFKLLGDCYEGNIYQMWQWGNSRFTSNRIIECRSVEDFSNVPHDSYIEGSEFERFEFNTNAKLTDIRFENARIYGGQLTYSTIVKLHVVNSSIKLDYCSSKNPFNLTVTDCNKLDLETSGANSLSKTFSRVDMDRVEKRIIKFNGTGSVVVTEKFYWLHSWYKFTTLNGIDSFVAEVWDFMGGVWKPYSGPSSVFGNLEWSMRITAQVSQPSEIHLEYTCETQPKITTY